MSSTSSSAVAQASPLSSRSQRRAVCVALPRLWPRSRKRALATRGVPQSSRSSISVLAVVPLYRVSSRWPSARRRISKPMASPPTTVSVWPGYCPRSKRFSGSQIGGCMALPLHAEDGERHADDRQPVPGPNPVGVELAGHDRISDLDRLVSPAAGEPGERLAADRERGPEGRHAQEAAGDGGQAAEDPQGTATPAGRQAPGQGGRGRDHRPRGPLAGGAGRVGGRGQPALSLAMLGRRDLAPLEHAVELGHGDRQDAGLAPDVGDRLPRRREGEDVPGDVGRRPAEADRGIGQRQVRTLADGDPAWDLGGRDLDAPHGLPGEPGGRGQRADRLERDGHVVDGALGVLLRGQDAQPELVPLFEQDVDLLALLELVLAELLALEAELPERLALEVGDLDVDRRDAAARGLLALGLLLTASRGAHFARPFPQALQQLLVALAGFLGRLADPIDGGRGQGGAAEQGDGGRPAGAEQEEGARHAAEGAGEADGRGAEPDEGAAEPGGALGGGRLPLRQAGDRLAEGVGGRGRAGEGLGGSGGLGAQGPEAAARFVDPDRPDLDDVALVESAGGRHAPGASRKRDRPGRAIPGRPARRSGAGALAAPAAGLSRGRLAPGRDRIRARRLRRPAVHGRRLLIREGEAGERVPLSLELAGVLAEGAADGPIDAVQGRQPEPCIEAGAPGDQGPEGRPGEVWGRQAVGMGEVRQEVIEVAYELGGGADGAVSGSAGSIRSRGPSGIRLRSKKSRSTRPHSVGSSRTWSGSSPRQAGRTSYISSWAGSPSWRRASSLERAPRSIRNCRAVSLATSRTVGTRQRSAPRPGI